MADCHLVERIRDFIDVNVPAAISANQQQSPWWWLPRWWLPRRQACSGRDPALFWRRQFETTRNSHIKRFTADDMAQPLHKTTRC